MLTLHLRLSSCETLVISRRSPRFRHLVSALDCHQSKRRCSCKSLQAWFSNSPYWLPQMTCSSLEFTVLSSSVVRASTSVWNVVDWAIQFPSGTQKKLRNFFWVILSAHIILFNIDCHTSFFFTLVSGNLIFHWYCFSVPCGFNMLLMLCYCLQQKPRKASLRKSKKAREVT